MRIEIRPLAPHDVDAAAALLAARHRADRSRTPDLSPSYESETAARATVEQALAAPFARGVAATQGGTLTGFLIGSIALPPPTSWFSGFLPPRSGQIGYGSQAASGDDAGEVYRAMYAALAPSWLERGCFAHFVEVNAEDTVALDAWFSLGFGQVMTLAVRDTSPVAESAERPPAGVEIHQAGAEDIDVVMQLNDELMRHHNASPIFLPYLTETEASAREHQAELLADPANAHWIAYHDGRPAGMQTFQPPTFAEMARPDRSIYLFQGVTTADGRGAGVGTALLRRSMEWAREAGHERCVLHFFSANIPGARFWLGSGFRPLTYRLVRRVDERIAWANGTMSDER